MLAESAAGWAWWAYYALAAMLAVGSYTDIRYEKIPNWITLPGVVVGLVGHALTGGLTGRDSVQVGLAGSAAGLAVGFVPLMLAWLAGGIGGGDAKLMGAVGALTGWRFTLAAMLYGFVAAAVMALVVMVARRVTWSTLRRIGRSVALLLAPGHVAIDPATKDSPKVPFGLALCFGAALALAEVIWRGPVAKKLVMGW
ncbi:MAG TPA: A24 family peptidase [Phycisphaerae bacterium]|nr:A24 family peptidase [Phycisphaerae bacterium]HUU21816.1 A24 family peptidase [Phycisphaerae bacterium]